MSVTTVLRMFYTLCYCLLTPLLYLRLFWKSRRLPAYRKRILERFGYGLKPTCRIDIWLHAVSLGEVNAALPLIQALLKKNKTLLITTMTPTGSQRVNELFQDNVYHQYIPYEYPWALQRFFKHYQPQVGIIFETEIWPNLLYYAQQAQVRLLLFNARLSENSMRGYLKIAPLVKNTLQYFSGIYAQSQADAERFKILGARAQALQVAGNIKFDLALPNILAEPYLQLKARWGQQRLVIIAASTHEGEERQLLKSFQSFQAAEPHALLLIAPRHPERFQPVLQLANQFGFTTGLRSQIDTMRSDCQVIILDTLGELISFYALSDYAFVGGSLVAVGGHNILEPIAVQTPVLIGPYVKNFQTICDDLLKIEAIIPIQNTDDLFQRIVFLEQHLDAKQAMIKRAFELLQRNREVLTIYLEALSSLDAAQRHQGFHS